MSGRTARFSPILLAVALAGCGGGGGKPLVAPARVYFLRDGKVAAVARRLPLSEKALLGALRDGPTADERRIGIAPGEGGAQVVYTLSQFDPAAPVTYRGKRYTRAGFEDRTPAILVESPLPFQTVHVPQLHAGGTANTFEATFEYDLLGLGGKLLAHHFVTATSGNGQRGTFDFDVPFSVERSEPGKLVVYERSAENGRRIHVVEIPLRLSP